MRILRLACLLVLPAAVAACGGMNRAVAVLPNTTDDLARKSEPFRAGRPPPAARLEPPPAGF